MKRFITILMEIGCKWEILLLVWADGDRFGRFTSLSADGTIMAIGAPQSGAGYVKVFEYNGSSWVQKGSKLTGDATGDEFGTCVSLSADGSRLAVGAFKIDSGVNSNEGQVKIYDYSSDWTETASIEEGVEGDYAGYSLSLSSDGTIIAIGAYNSDAGGTGRGITRIYREDSGYWENIGSISGSADNEESGVSVSLNSYASLGTILAVGVYKADIANVGDDAGCTRIYEYVSGMTWSQIGDSIPGVHGCDQSGKFVDLNDDGSMDDYRHP